MTGILANEDCFSDFVRSVFTRAYPPGDPFVRRDWIGVAFDRNRYEQLAPAEWWKALILSSVRVLDESHVFIAEAKDRSTVHVLPNDEAAIFEYLDVDSRFLRDHWLVGGSGRWACLLDQDVSLFGGESEFMTQCMQAAGGKEHLLIQMSADFLGEEVSLGPSADPFVQGFQRYFSRLLGSDGG